MVIIQVDDNGVGFFTLKQWEDSCNFKSIVHENSYFNYKNESYGKLILSIINITISLKLKILIF